MPGEDFKVPCRREEAGPEDDRQQRALRERLREVESLLEESRAGLAQAGKMAELGGLLAGIAHEINTPLASISSNTDNLSVALQRLRGLIGAIDPGLAESARRECEEALAIAEEALRTNRIACDRVLKIVGGLRTFARRDEIAPQKANIHEGIEGTLALLAHEIKRRIRVVKEYELRRELLCFPDQLNQVFMNILINAAQAIENQGEIRIRTWEEGDKVRISIADNGKGIPAELQSRIFDSGFTTKKAGEGTGLGLAISRRIVEAHGGTIEFKSDPGRGTTFTIVLPARTAEEMETNGR